MGRPTFSSKHIAKGERTDDSQRLRSRLALYLRNVESYEVSLAAQQLAQEAGAAVSHLSIGKYLLECSIAEFLDAVSHIFDGLPSRGGSYPNERRPRDEWLRFTTRAFEEEHVGYRVLPDASVTYYVDEEFEQARVSAIAELDDAQFDTALKHLKDAFEDLKRPGSEARAIDALFKAAENVYKVISGEHTLKKNEAQAYFTKRIVGELSQPERTGTTLMLQSFGQWIAACHQYRHADGNTTPTPPSRQFAIWAISSGLSHLRWMVSVRNQCS